MSSLIRFSAAHRWISKIIHGRFQLYLPEEERDMIRRGLDRTFAVWNRYEDKMTMLCSVKSDRNTHGPNVTALLCTNCGFIFFLVRRFLLLYFFPVGNVRKIDLIKRVVWRDSFIKILLHCWLAFISFSGCAGLRKIKSGRLSPHPVSFMPAEKGIHSLEMLTSS